MLWWAASESIESTATVNVECLTLMSGESKVSGALTVTDDPGIGHLLSL